MMFHRHPDANTDDEDGYNGLYTKINGIIKCLYIIQCYECFTKKNILNCFISISTQLLNREAS